MMGRVRRSRGGKNLSQRSSLRPLLRLNYEQILRADDSGQRPVISVIIYTPFTHGRGDKETTSRAVSVINHLR